VAEPRRHLEEEATVGGPFGGNASRNFGWGKGLGYAAKAALRERYGDGHFATVAEHDRRWSAAADYFRNLGIRDAKEIGLAQLHGYAARVAEAVDDGVYKISYAQNLLSTTNVVLQAMRGDKKVRVSPADHVGRRCHIRLVPPTGLDRDEVRRCAECLREEGMPRAAAVLELARALGPRLRECALADLVRWRKEFKDCQAVNIQDGTKGGRDAPRWVGVDAFASDAILRALEARPLGSRNLIAADEQLIRGKHVSVWTPPRHRGMGSHEKPPSNLPPWRLASAERTPVDDAVWVNTEKRLLSATAV
jgi:hypothetical protein